jgi:hypothetical protein
MVCGPRAPTLGHGRQQQQPGKYASHWHISRHVRTPCAGRQ